MKSYRTNTGQTITAKDFDSAIQELAQKYASLASERLKCPMKTHELARFNSPRMTGTGVRFIIVPDLPEFVCRQLIKLPQVDHSFLITEGDDGGKEKWEIENNGPLSIPYLYEGEDWNSIAFTHCYFIAGRGAVQGGRDASKIFIDRFECPAPGQASGLIRTQDPGGMVSTDGFVGAKGEKI